MRKIELARQLAPSVTKRFNELNDTSQFFVDEMVKFLTDTYTMSDLQQMKREYKILGHWVGKKGE